MDQQLKSWVHLSSHLLGDCFDLVMTRYQQCTSAFSTYLRFVAIQLNADCHFTGESALNLTSEQKLWDADILVRAVTEGSLKLAYILNATPDERERLADEYWNVLPQFAEIKHSENATRLLALVSDADALQWQPLRDLLVPAERVNEIRKKHSKKNRNSLEERWSFFGLCQTFAAHENTGLRGIAGLAHGYSMNSHLLHKDAIGVGMVWERFTSAQPRRDAAILGHAARIVSDLWSMTKLRASSMLLAAGIDPAEVVTIEQRYSQLVSEIKQANADFNKAEYESET